MRTNAKELLYNDSLNNIDKNLTKLINKKRTLSKPRKGLFFKF